MSGVDSFFVDTNILLYAIDASAGAKRGIARKFLNRLWEDGSGRLSWLVLDEFYVNMTRKLELPNPAARAAVSVFASWHPVDSSPALLERAWHWMDQAEMSYWDALIVAAAERSGARWLLSEDFETGRDFAGLIAVNPFTPSPMLIP